MIQRVYEIGGMHCSGCARTVKNILSKVEGVTNAEVALDSNLATLEFSHEVDTAILQNALEGTGYTIQAKTEA